MVDGNYLEQLNEAQRRAVEHLGSPELVIAGAGSGKTRVLTYKIVHLLHNGMLPSHILALTFTNKAAREMRERIAALVGEETASRLWMGTFHSIFSRILRRHSDKLGFKSNFTVYDASDSKSLIRTIVKDLGLDDKYYRPGALASEISWAKNQLVSPSAYAADGELMAAARNKRIGRIDEVYRTYCDRCRIAGAMDFDDLLYYTNVLFRDHPELLEDYKNYFEYVLVDEYQDTNFAQHNIISRLCGGKDTICLVGDDAQSIYSFRGANIHNILDLRKWYTNLTEYKLEQNYRSTRNILGAANSLIAANREQIAKEIFSKNEEGDRIEIVRSETEYEEAAAVASHIGQTRRMLGLPSSEIAVLYRTNAQSRVLEEALRNRNIPYRIYGGLAFYQRKEIKDAVSYFRLSINPDDDEAFVRVINTPKRGIGDTTVAKIRAAAVSARVSMSAVISDPSHYGLDVNKGTLAKLAAFAELLKDISAKAGICPADEAARYIVDRSCLLDEYRSGDTPENISKRENLEELLNGVKNFTEERFNAGDNATMGDYLSQIALMTDQDEASDGNDSVTLMTIHSAKGLEFGAVFITGVEENLLPSDKSRTPSDIEEERRLLYVAITRAKKFCMMSYAARRMVNGQTNYTAPSRFIQDIDPRYLRPMHGTQLAPRRAPQPKTFGASSTFPGRFASPLQTTTARPEETKIHTAIGASPATIGRTAADSGEFSVHSSGELRTGQRIQHSTFGLGVIRDIDTSREEHRITAEFSDGKKRLLLLKFARFKILS